MELSDINTITVLGAGSMGHGIAEVAALAGYDVNLRDINDEFVTSGYDQIEWSLGKLAEKERITQGEADAALERVTPLVNFEEAVVDTDFVIEAVPERMDIKKDVYGELESYAPDHAVFATNTSSLSITELADVTERPELFCGMHFFNPPVRMPLVEVISGAHTSEETMDVTAALAEDFGKTPVRVRKDVPGFIVNRILVPFLNEAAWMVHEGEATVAEIDSTTKFGMGHPMGSFELTDQVGIDVSFHVLDYINEVLGKAYEPSPLLVEKVENETFGKKTDKGFYDYENGGVEIPSDQVRDDVEQRLVAMMANEIAALIGDGVASASEIDTAMMLGTGVPEGPANVADAAGLDELVAVLDERYEETGHPRYEAREFLRERAEVGGFYEPVGDADEASTAYDALSVTVDGAVGHIEIDREHRMNAINLDVIEELDVALDEFEDNEDVRAVLITGAGDRAFSAGADIQGLISEFGDGFDAMRMSKNGQGTFGRLETLSMPVVAAIDGYCLGGGMELSICADIRIASTRSTFGQPEHDLGLLPGWGGTQRLPRLIGEARAKEIIFTADHFDAETMQEYGFVAEVVDVDAFEERAWELARDLAAGPPLAQELTKQAMLKGRDDIEAGLELEASAFGHLRNTDDVMEGAMAMMEDRDPEFEGK